MNTVHLVRDRSADMPTWRVWIRGPVIEHFAGVDITDDRYAGKVQQQGRGYVPLTSPAIIYRTRADAVRALLEETK